MRRWLFDPYKDPPNGTKGLKVRSDGQLIGILELDVTYRVEEQETISAGAF